MKQSKTRIIIALPNYGAMSDHLQPVYVRDFTEQTGPAVPVPS